MRGQSRSGNLGRRVVEVEDADGLSAEQRSHLVLETIVFLCESTARDEMRTEQVNSVGLTLMGAEEVTSQVTKLSQF